MRHRSNSPSRMLTFSLAVVAGLAPIQNKYHEIMAEPGYIDGVLRGAAERVTPIANSTIEVVKKRMGLYT